MDYKEVNKRFSLLLEALEAEGMPDEVIFDPSKIYSTYYAILLSQDVIGGVSNSDLAFIAMELKEYYLDKYKTILALQIMKYWTRRRVSDKFKRMANKYNNFKDLEDESFPMLVELMNNTFRSDMNRLNKRWIDLAVHLRQLSEMDINTVSERSTKKTIEQMLLKMDRINNIVHNTGDVMLDKFTNSKELLKALDDSSRISPDELKKRISDKFLKSL